MNRYWLVKELLAAFSLLHLACRGLTNKFYGFAREKQHNIVIDKIPARGSLEPYQERFSFYVLVLSVILR